MLILSVFAHILDYILDYILEIIQIAQYQQNRFDMLEYLDVIGSVGNVEDLPKVSNCGRTCHRTLLHNSVFRHRKHTCKDSLRQGYATDFAINQIIIL